LNVVLTQNVSLDNHLALSTYLRNIAKYLSRIDGLNLQLIVQESTAIPEELSRAEVHMIKSDTYSVRENLRFSWQLFRALKEISTRFPPDIIHCLYPNSSVLGAVMFKRLVMPRTKIVYDIRSPWIENSIARLDMNRGIEVYRGLAYLSEAVLARLADSFIFITEGLKEKYEDMLKMKMEPSILIPSGVDLELFSRKDGISVRGRYGIDGDNILVGYVGVLSRERELDFSLKAFHEVVSGDDRYRLMMVGEGEDKKRLEGLSRAMGLGDYVYFTGEVDHREVPSFISDFDLALCHLPNSFNFRFSFPMKVLEYSSCGTRVVASDIPAHEEISKSIPMVLYKADDVHDLSRKILEHESFEWVDDQRALSGFSWESIARDMTLNYREILRG
jgi:glycosyltransferase involved in cell wall biosynthesis